MEVEAYLARHYENRDERERALVVCEGHGGERKVTIGSGTVPIRAPRVNDKGVIDGEMNARGVSEARGVRPGVRCEVPEGDEESRDGLRRDDDALRLRRRARKTKHLRSTNPIESTFATVKLRQRVTKGAGSRAAGLAMAFKLSF